MPPVILDGAMLARRRLPLIAARAAAVRRDRGRAPAVMLVAFGEEDGHVPYVSRKESMCAQAGIDGVTLVVRPGTDTESAVGRMHDQLRERPFDGVFVQFPFPGTIDGDAVASAVPVELDVDVMTPARIARFMNDSGELPPVTVSAALALLDEYSVKIDGRSGVVVAEEHPFALMMGRALSLRGAGMAELVSPAHPDLDDVVRSAGLVVVSAALPGLVQSTTLAPGAVAIDVGYFNPGGRGDIAVSGGVDHLGAIAPVPGGIGPMTVSSLLERVVLFAEQRST